MFKRMCVVWLKKSHLYMVNIFNLFHQIFSDMCCQFYFPIIQCLQEKHSQKVKSFLFHDKLAQNVSRVSYPGAFLSINKQKFICTKYKVVQEFYQNPVLILINEYKEVFIPLLFPVIILSSNNIVRQTFELLL